MEKEGGQGGGGGGGQFIGRDIVRGTEVRPGVWRYSIRGHVFDVPKRYTPIKWLGQGSYGIVWCAHTPLPSPTPSPAWLVLFYLFVHTI
jgi:hypothetical protein